MLLLSHQMSTREELALHLKFSHLMQPGTQAASFLPVLLMEKRLDFINVNLFSMR